MSRVIKSAVMHDNPKVLKSPKVERPLDEASMEDSLAAHIIMVEEKQRKAQQMVQDAEMQRNVLIAESQQQAQQILDEANQKAGKIEITAYEKGKLRGYDNGYEEGRKAVLEDLQKTVFEANEKAQRVVALAENEKKTSILNAEAKIVEIAMAVVDKVLPQHFIDAPQIILPLVRSALEKVKDQNSIVIRVCPDDYELVLMAKNEFQMIIESDEVLTITQDRTVGKGGCIIESANGSVDARLKTQLDLLKKAIQEVL